MKFRRKTFWFTLVFGQWVGCRPPDHHRDVIATRTMRGVWGEWW